MKQLKWIGFFGLLLAAGCSSSKITTSWKVPGATPFQYKRVLVLGLIHDKDRRIQERMEQHFAGDLTDLGYTAVSALQEYGPKAFDNLDEKTALAKIKGSNVDAVITIVLLDKQKERTYVPGHTYYRDNFWDYFGARYRIVYEPGYYVTDTRYFWESNLYDMSKQSLVYSVQTKSFAAASTEAMGHEYGQLIVKNMVRQKVLKPQKADIE